MALSLSLTPVSPALFTESLLTDLFALSLDLINTLPSRSSPPPAPATKIAWSAGKSDAETKLWKATYGKEPWIARVTEVSDISYDALRRGLVTEKSATEKAALMGVGDEIEDVSEKRVLGDVTTYGNGEIWCVCARKLMEKIDLDVNKLLHIQAFSAREFLETVMYKEFSERDGVGKQCVIISLPRVGDIKDASHAHGVYVSIDVIRDLGNGKTEVIMACTVSLLPRTEVSGADQIRVTLEVAFRDGSRIWQWQHRFWRTARSSSST
jgi:hypothetical protein